MKRIRYSAGGPALADLLDYTALFDEKKLVLDSYEIQNLLECVAVTAKQNLTRSTELRFRGVRIHKAVNGRVSVRLEHRNISYTLDNAAA